MPLVVALGVGALLVFALAWFAIDATLPTRAPHPARSGHGPFVFPAGFLWGAASADHQVESSQDDDWTAFERDARAHGRAKFDANGPVPGHIRGIVDVDATVLQKKTDYDARFDSDIELAHAMGHNAYRFSISWARLFPRANMAAPDPAGIAYYLRIFDALAARNIKPVVTLFHFASPSWLWQDSAGLRGLERADAEQHFAVFVEACARAFGDRVTMWCTLNEPLVYVFMGYLKGIFPPNEQRTQRRAMPIARVLVKLHLRAYAVLKADARSRGIEVAVGLAHHVRTFLPWSNGSLRDRITAFAIERLFVHWFLARITSNTDFIGVNYYGRYYIKAKGLGGFDIITADPADRTETTSDVGWATDHAGLTRSLVLIGRRYRHPMYVLENGIADREHDDVRRRAFIVGQAHAVHQAIATGVDVRGYVYWSLTDNFEWAEGFEPRFGFVDIDYANNFARKQRASGALFERIARANAITDDDWQRER